jgi:uncharacterized membrane-anchored protein YjiN (DUF445 family)
MKKRDREASIIEIIEKMVQAGEPEEKILQSLKDIGVKESQAKRLLLLGEANTFAVLKNEIRKLVKEDMKKEEEVLKGVIKEQVQEAGEKLDERIKEEINALKKSMMQQVEEEETKEAKKKKLIEIVRMLDEPTKTHGIKFNGIVSGKHVGKKKKGKLDELRI